ncbi:disintegrin and metalloproteinase domain-containing protein 2-like isoform X2 [Sceloporus undulatus]|uniref:disintegrin and metalloproteinase domain-containing protein 2-like isoform X2 n=1 Tax=Sceloporus undulatus TaxID=8520 RepID=UPI001C4C8449|nr:disintegrin and metalloproteinase domain-containing protein 2-like isoform X2 [Sceloporus undulatus]
MAMMPLQVMLMLLMLLTCLVSVLGSQRTFLQVTVPQRIPPKDSGHTRDCYYQGYIDGYVDSLVMLNTCSGLSGLLQLENISYGIEPVESASGFQHLIYQMQYNDADLHVSKHNYSIRWSAVVAPRADEIPVNFSTVRYVEMHVVVAKSLYDYMGSNEDDVMGKIAQLISFVNAMFYKLNTRIVLSSLEFWSYKDKMSTMGTADELLQRFVNWKHVHLTLRPHDLAFLFIYKVKSDSVGATFAKKICLKTASTGIAVFQKGITLETFSVIVAQLLGITLGLHFDDSRRCQCPGAICIMNTEAIQFSGLKSFSSCSIKDYRNFLGYGSAQCLLNKPRIDITYRAPTCGNKIVEEGEQCDCGSMKECELDFCCASDCTLKPGKECSQGECCIKDSCELKEKGVICRETVDSECDLIEYCNGTSPVCTEDFFVEDGQMCDGGKGICMAAVCQSADQWCQRVFGKDSKSGSSQCYEEINSQRDRMGHCGSTARGYENCQWQDLRCGKLVCEYKSKKPFAIENAAIIYAKVQDEVCVTLDYMKGLAVKDPFLVHDGSVCGTNKVCMNQRCVDRSVIKVRCNVEANCNKRGKCNNRGNCHCDKGWAPPNCNVAEDGGIGGSIDSTYRIGFPTVTQRRKMPHTTRNWLLIAFFLFLPVIVGSVILAVKLRDIFTSPKVEEEGEDEDYETEGSRSQEANQSEMSSV